MVNRLALYCFISLFCNIVLSQEQLYVNISSDDQENPVFTWEHQGEAPAKLHILTNEDTLHSAPIEAASARQLTYLLLLLDTSNSMGRALQNGIKPYLKKHLPEIPSHYRLALAVFDDSLRVINHFSDGDTLLLPEIEKISAGRKRTELFGWLIAGMDLFPETADVGKKILIFSDGVKTDTAYELEDVLKKAEDEKVTIFSAAYYNKREDQRLRRLSDETGGYFEQAGNGAELGQQFNEALFSVDNYRGSATLNLAEMPNRPYGEQSLDVVLALADGHQLRQIQRYDFGKTPEPAWIWPLITLALLGIITAIVFYFRRRQGEDAEVVVEEAPVLCPVCNATIPKDADQCARCGVPVGEELAWLEAAKGEVFPIRSRSCTIGATENNEIVLNHEKISRDHSIIDYKDQQFILTDRNSTNGTFVNDRRVTGSVTLYNGDIIRFANLHFQFTVNPRIKQNIQP